MAMESEVGVGIGLPKLAPVSSIISFSLSDSMCRQKRQALDLLKQYASHFGFDDPRTVCSDSPNLLLNLFNYYAGINHRESDEVIEI